ncbi:unnamed protein product, partial [Oppiella nova]
MVWMSTGPEIHLLFGHDAMNQLCKVCGEPAAGYHFGAFTCEGCKVGIGIGNSIDDELRDKMTFQEKRFIDRHTIDSLSKYKVGYISERFGSQGLGH